MFIFLFHRDYYFISVQWVDTMSLSVVWMARSQNYSVVSQCTGNLWYCAVVSKCFFFPINANYISDYEMTFREMLSINILQISLFALLYFINVYIYDVLKPQCNCPHNLLPF